MGKVREMKRKNKKSSPANAVLLLSSEVHIFVWTMADGLAWSYE